MGYATLSWPVDVDKERFVAVLEIQRGRRAERQMRLLRVRGLAELSQVTSCSPTQGIWLGDRNVGSQVVGKDQSQLLGKLGEEDKKSQ